MENSMYDEKKYLEQDPEETIENVLNIMEALPVPGFAEVIGPINAILDTQREDPIDEVLKEITKANDMLNNMFNVVKTALELQKIEESLADQSNELEKIGTNIKQNNKNAESYESPLDEIKSNFNDVLTFSRKYLINYRDNIIKTNSGTLSEAIGGCMKAVEYAYEAYAILTDAYRQLHKFHKNTSSPKGNWKYLLERSVIHVNYAGEQYDEFVKELDNFYPACIKPIMLGKFKIECYADNKASYIKIVEWISKEAEVFTRTFDISEASYFELENLSNPQDGNEATWHLKGEFEKRIYHVGSAHLKKPSESLEHNTFPMLSPLSKPVKDESGDNNCEKEKWVIKIENEKLDFARTKHDSTHDDGCSLNITTAGADGFLTIRKNNYFEWGVVSDI